MDYKGLQNLLCLRWPGTLENYFTLIKHEFGLHHAFQARSDKEENEWMDPNNIIPSIVLK